MEQFSLEKYLENPSRKVVTRDGRVVKILDTEFESGNGNKFILAKCIYNNKAAVYVYTTDGKANNIGETENDILFADEEEKPQSIEIPFGAKDYEFIRDEYLIPDGYEARIEGNKVIIEKIQKEEELTKFEKGLVDLVSGWCDSHIETPEEYINKHSQTLLDLARKELKNNDWRQSLRSYKDTYEQGKRDALKDLPKWKKATEHKDLEKHIAILEENKVFLSDYLEEGDYYIDLEDLETLPKEE